ncbi:RidA family protein [bacterium]|nr:RidA family protein [bacterium]MCI0603630.1 RidA family protein [bacterium]
MKRAFMTEQAPKPVGPYSQVIQYGEFLFLAGQVPLTPEGKMNDGDIVAQTRQVLNNIKAVLEAAGSSINRVLKTTIFLADLGDFETVNGVYAEYFQEPYPARSTVEVSKLPKGARLEIDAIASRS